MPVIFTLILVAAFLLWLLLPRTRNAEPRGDPIEPVDLEELEAAEREVRDLGVEQRPEDGFEGDDWGPGAGTRRGGRD
jgi:hypothetical protein